MKTKNPSLLLGLLITFLLSAPTLAGDPAGWWSSSSGSKIHLWANMQQVVVTVQNSKGQYKYNGRWTRFSDYFSYQAGNVRYDAAFVGRNQIQVKGSDGSLTTWTRGAATARPQPQPRTQAQGIGGLYSSSTGSSVQIATQGNQVFVTVIGSDGKRYQGSGRWTAYPSRFDYSIPGIQGIAHCTVLQGGTIRVDYNSPQPSYWTRR